MLALSQFKNLDQEVARRKGGIKEAEAVTGG
jgi:hypothetical protein